MVDIVQGQETLSCQFLYGYGCLFTEFCTFLSSRTDKVSAENTTEGPDGEETS